MVGEWLCGGGDTRLSDLGVPESGLGLCVKRRRYEVQTFGSVRRGRGYEVEWFGSAREPFGNSREPFGNDVKWVGSVRRGEGIRGGVVWK